MTQHHENTSDLKTSVQDLLGLRDLVLELYPLLMVVQLAILKEEGEEAGISLGELDAQIRNKVLRGIKGELREEYPSASRSLAPYMTRLRMAAGKVDMSPTLSRRGRALQGVFFDSELLSKKNDDGEGEQKKSRYRISGELNTADLGEALADVRQLLNNILTMVGSVEQMAKGA
jgi:hypothetical protein